jgi:hypothetical protein
LALAAAAVVQVSSPFDECAAGLGTGFLAAIQCLALMAYDFFVYSVRITF